MDIGDSLCSNVSRKGALIYNKKRVLSNINMFSAFLFACRSSIIHNIHLSYSGNKKTLKVKTIKLITFVVLADPNQKPTHLSKHRWHPHTMYYRETNCRTN